MNPLANPLKSLHLKQKIYDQQRSPNDSTKTANKMNLDIMQEYKSVSSGQSMPLSSINSPLLSLQMKTCRQSNKSIVHLYQNSYPHFQDYIKRKVTIQNQRLKYNLNYLDKDIKKYEQNQSKFNKILQQYTQKISALKHHLKSKSKTIRILTQQNIQYKTKLTFYKIQLQNINQKLNTLKYKQHEFQQLSNSKEVQILQEMQKIKISYENEEKQKIELKRENGELADKIVQFTKENSELKEIIETYQKNISLKSKQIELCHEKITNMHEQIEYRRKNESYDSSTEDYIKNLIDSNRQYQMISSSLMNQVKQLQCRSQKVKLNSQFMSAAKINYHKISKLKIVNCIVDVRQFANKSHLGGLLNESILAQNDLFIEAGLRKSIRLYRQRIIFLQNLLQLQQEKYDEAVYFIKYIYKQFRLREQIFHQGQQYGQQCGQRAQNRAKQLALSEMRCLKSEKLKALYVLEQKLNDVLEITNNNLNWRRSSHLQTGIHSSSPYSEAQTTKLYQIISSIKNDIKALSKERQLSIFKTNQYINNSIQII